MQNAESDNIAVGKPNMLVLLSGGIDSAACIDFYINLGRSLMALFIDYGQLASTRELISAKSVAAHYSVPLRTLKLRNCGKKATGLVPARNCFLISAALMERPTSVSMIAIGVHAGTNYPDCSESFIRSMQKAIDCFEPSKVHLAAPFISWTKADIFEYCVLRNVPIGITYSCEQGGSVPCGKCLSCRDRELLNDRS